MCSWNKSYTVNFSDLLPQVFDGSVTRSFRSKNYQAFEFGLDHLNNDGNYILSELQRLDRQFDLVILTEYYFEGIVLLADLLCDGFTNFKFCLFCHYFGTWPLFRYMTTIWVFRRFSLRSTIKTFS